MTRDLSEVEEDAVLLFLFPPGMGGAVEYSEGGGSGCENGSWSKK